VRRRSHVERVDRKRLDGHRFFGLSQIVHPIDEPKEEQVKNFMIKLEHTTSDGDSPGAGLFGIRRLDALQDALPGENAASLHGVSGSKSTDGGPGPQNENHRCCDPHGLSRRAHGDEQACGDSGDAHNPQSHERGTSRRPTLLPRSGAGRRSPRKKLRFVDIDAATKLRAGAPVVEINGGNIINASAPVVELNAGNIARVNGPFVDINGTAKLRAGSALVEVNGVTVLINGSGAISIKGGVVSIEGSTVNIKGGSVNLNC
jgi:hypothetical protein